MYFNDHNPPHFHAKYNEYEALIDIKELKLISGKLPSRVLGLVIEWASQHIDELYANWNKASDLQKINKIEPLQ